MDFHSARALASLARHLLPFIGGGVFGLLYLVAFVLRLQRRKAYGPGGGRK